jgi:ATP-binding cassette subfamily B protein
MALAALAMTGAELALPAIFGRAVDDVVTNGAAGPWLAWCAALVAVLVASEALDDFAAGAAIARSTAWVRRTVLRHVLAVGTRGDNRLNAGEVTTRLVGNASDAARLAPDVVRAGANVILGLGGAVALALIHPWLCLAFLSGMPVLLLLVRAFARDASALAGRYLEVQGRIAGRLVEAISGARTIAAAGTTDREAARVLAPLPELHRHGIGMWRVHMRISWQDAVIVSGLEIAVLAVAGVLLARGRITPGELLAASQYVLLAASLGSVVNAINRLARARAAAERLVDVLDQPAVEYGSGQLPPGGGRLEFRGVTVRSGGRPVLDGLDLEVPAGALVAVVGRTGAGKSLLASLAGRLVDPDEGEVLLDGKPVHFRSPSDAHKAGIETVFQTLALAPSLDIATNMFLGREERRGKVLGGALRLLDKRRMRREARDYLSNLKIGIQSMSQTVDTLSGGQRQGVAVMRAAAWGRRVVIMDEPTAALGVKESAMVLDLIRHIRDGGMPVILISHDMPHVFEIADRIHVMRLGRRVAVVTPQTHSMPEAVAIMTGATPSELERSLHPESPTGEDAA